MPDVTYCHKRTTKGALNKAHHLDAATRADAAYRNSLDQLFYDAALEVFAWKACCFKVDAAALDKFREKNLAWRAARTSRGGRVRWNRCLGGRRERRFHLV